MVDPLFDAGSRGGKHASALFHTLHPDHPGLKAEGVAQHWAVDYDVQVILMGLVIETGSATIADLVAALPGHPAPVAAIMALVDAGHLSRAPGVLTPFTSIFCGRDIASRSGPGVDENNRPPPKQGPLRSRTLIAFPTQRSHKRDTGVPAIRADAVGGRGLVRLLNTFARLGAHVIALACAVALGPRPARQKRSWVSPLVSGASS